DWIETSRLRIQSDMPRVTETVPDTPEKRDELIAPALERDPAARPPSARQLRERLLALLPDLANVLLPIELRRAAAPATRPVAGPGDRTLPSPGADPDRTNLLGGSGTPVEVKRAGPLGPTPGVEAPGPASPS